MRPMCVATYVYIYSAICLYEYMYIYVWMADDSCGVPPTEFPRKVRKWSYGIQIIYIHTGYMCKYTYTYIFLWEAYVVIPPNDFLESPTLQMRVYR